MNNLLSKNQLIQLVEEIVNPQTSEEEINKKIEILERNVTHPAPTDIIFWNEEELSPIEIVERLLNYKPISL
ncbi:bacteriocin immunity protein [Bacillus suaedaesalsae]|uniref:Bacteriocin immunity protein n=1 Tax=Bacillus suaedaesalsae TaxID=2810349 RepID=A0ABS2DHC5_9BACI|nr:bacteriocin immunity protein [Bacillus suaedaesalsae]MBM6616948.1 bacteriocin immunity protein [Bacillus suaedaesalsae]